MLSHIAKLTPAASFDQSQPNGILTLCVEAHGPGMTRFEAYSPQGLDEDGGSLKGNPFRGSDNGLDGLDGLQEFAELQGWDHFQ